MQDSVERRLTANHERRMRYRRVRCLELKRHLEARNTENLGPRRRRRSR